LVTLAAARFSIITSSAVAFFCGGLTYYCFLFAQQYRSRSTVFAALALTFIIWALLARLSDPKFAASVVGTIRNAVPAGTISILCSRAMQILCGRVREFALFPSLISLLRFWSLPRLPWDGERWVESAISVLELTCFIFHCKVSQSARRYGFLCGAIFLLNLRRSS
jgi:hypothetical protein